MDPVEIRLRPQWRDQDALGHVNNAVYSTWLENARDAWWTAVSGPCARFPFLLARTEIDFRAPATWRDEVVVRVRLERIGNSSFDLSYVVEDPSGRRFAEARTVLVMTGPDGRPAPIAPELRRKMESRGPTSPGPR